MAKLNQTLVKKMKLDAFSKQMLKQGAENVLESVNEHLNKYGALCYKDLDVYQRFTPVLRDMLPGYGSINGYFSLLAGASESKEFPDKKLIHEGAIKFLQANGYVFYPEAKIFTKKKLKEILK